jgi:Xaa-Pro aminopeptidase
MFLLSCAGNNANIIHYIESVGGVEVGDLLLKDAGSEYYRYSRN